MPWQRPCRAGRPAHATRAGTFPGPGRAPKPHPRTASIRSGTDRPTDCAPRHRTVVACCSHWLKTFPKSAIFQARGNSANALEYAFELVQAVIGDDEPAASAAPVLDADLGREFLGQLALQRDDIRIA